MPTTRRPLVLHVSALSNAEYDTYTSSLAEVTSPLPDADWDHITMGVREARGWIRGRYGVDGSVIDQILRYFCPELGPHDVLTGGQFFAALRLVSHAQAGAIVDENLVFVQANPNPPAPRPSSPLKGPPLTRTPSSKLAPPPPPRPSTENSPTLSLPPRTAPPLPSPNPFTRTKSHTISRETYPQHEQPASSNPFRRSSSVKGPPSSSASSSSSSAAAAQYAQASPPLPPRKPSTTLLPPPRHASLVAASSSSPKPPTVLPTFAPPVPTPPLKPPKPPHATSSLIKQSLQAAKGAQSAQAVREGLSKERRWEVIKKSGGGGGLGSGLVLNGGSSDNSSKSGSIDSSKHERDEVRPPSPPPSIYDVAAARIGSVSPVPSSVTSDHVLASSDPPPSPNTPPSSGVNPRRTRSLHHPSPGSSPTQTPPAPPPRRKRPESVQVTGVSPFADTLNNDTSPGPNGRSSPSARVTGPLTRHLSFQASDAFHRTLETLRPGFESARVKAEGRVWPGGYVKGLRGADGGARPLVNGQEDEEGGFGQDRDEEGEEEERGVRERDELKMPVRPDEGWAVLG